MTQISKFLALCAPKPAFLDAHGGGFSETTHAFQIRPINEVLDFTFFGFFLTGGKRDPYYFWDTIFQSKTAFVRKNRSSKFLARMVGLGILDLLKQDSKLASHRFFLKCLKTPEQMGFCSYLAHNRHNTANSHKVDPKNQKTATLMRSSWSIF